MSWSGSLRSAHILIQPSIIRLHFGQEEFDEFIGWTLQTWDVDEAGDVL
jgi:hypothetical protein